jgi:hypothetical protein
MERPSRCHVPAAAHRPRVSGRERLRHSKFDQALAVPAASCAERDMKPEVRHDHSYHRARTPLRRAA